MDDRIQILNGNSIWFETDLHHLLTTPFICGRKNQFKSAAIHSRTNGLTRHQILMWLVRSQSNVRHFYLFSLCLSFIVRFLFRISLDYSFWWSIEQLIIFENVVLNTSNGTLLLFIFNAFGVGEVEIKIKINFIPIIIIHHSLAFSLSVNPFIRIFHSSNHSFTHSSRLFLLFLFEHLSSYLSFLLIFQIQLIEKRNKNNIFEALDLKRAHNWYQSYPHVQSY